jgi:hypothetical protein
MYLSLRKADFLLFFIFIAVAALIAAVPLVRSSDGAPRVRIIAQGDLAGIYPLDSDNEIEIERDGHRNVVVIKDNTVHMDYSDCKNQVCVNTGKISKPGETIVCLPKYVIVEIVSSEEGGEDDEAIDAVVK